MKSSRVLTGAAILVMLWLIFLVPACASDTPPPTPTVTPPAAPISAGTAEPTLSSAESGAAAGFSTAVAARTPIPTPTPSAIERRTSEVADRFGLGQRTFLGLTGNQWAELVGATLIIAGGYFFARLLVNQILKRIVKRTKTKLDDEMFVEVKDELQWLLILFIVDFAVSGLSFLGDTLRTATDDLFFVLNLIILTSMSLGLIQFAAKHYIASLDNAEDQDRLDPIITGIQRFAYFLVVIIAVSLGLSHFGANANTLYFTLLATVAIVSLAARDVITDALSGFIILADQPFRIGDSVLIQDLNTWGDVLDIGTRTTRILTVDNRELIVPNSKIAKSQIVNYNYPDTKYRLQTDIGIAYGIDIDLIRKTATDAVRGVKYVLDDKPVDVLFVEFDNAARKVRVRWWIDSFHNEWPAIDAVNVALESAFEKAGIEMPYETYDLQVHIKDGAGIVSQPEPPASGEDSKDDHRLRSE
jgi:small-conductance mechanosensitive channel